MLVTYSSHCSKRYVGDIFKCNKRYGDIFKPLYNKRYVGDIFKPLCNKRYVGDIFKPL